MLRLKTVTTPTYGNRIAVLELGPAETSRHTPILFVHPINLRKEAWLDVIRLLAVDRRCIAIDLAGHGESSDSSEFGIEVWVRDSVEVIEALKLDSVHLVGGSLGGAIIVGVAAEIPNTVRSIASFGSRLSPDTVAAVGEPDLLAMLDDQPRDDVFRHVAMNATAAGTSQDIIETVFSLTNTHPMPTLQNVWAKTIIADAAPWASGVRCPALVVNGGADTTCTPSMGQAFAKTIGANFVEMPGIGHLPALEDAEGTVALLEPHLLVAESTEGVRL